MNRVLTASSACCTAPTHSGVRTPIPSPGQLRRIIPTPRANPLLKRRGDFALIPFVVSSGYAIPASWAPYLKKLMDDASHANPCAQRLGELVRGVRREARRNHQAEADAEKNVARDELRLLTGSLDERLVQPGSRVPWVGWRVTLPRCAGHSVQPAFIRSRRTQVRRTPGIRPYGATGSRS
jgi:hypothetical protein